MAKGKQARVTILEGKELALHWRRTKIIATLGPASEAPEMIEKLLRAGVNLIRLNMSHGSHDSHRQAVRLIREISSRLGRHVAILMDLCGPKLRVGKFEAGAIQLRDGARVFSPRASLPARTD